MLSNFHVPFAVVLLIALIWTVLFSLPKRYPLRRVRYLGLLVCYISLITFLIAAGWKSALLTWAFFGLFGGLLYPCVDILLNSRLPEDREKVPHAWWLNFVAAQLVWPFMIPEAVEIVAAEFGLTEPVKLYTVSELDLDSFE